MLRSVDRTSGAAVDPGVARTLSVRTCKRVFAICLSERHGDVSGSIEAGVRPVGGNGGHTFCRGRSCCFEAVVRAVVLDRVLRGCNGGVLEVRLNLRSPCAFALVEEGRDGDGGENADDEDDDEELDEREALFVLFALLGE